MSDFWWLVIVNVLVAAWVTTTAVLVERSWKRAVEVVKLRREKEEASELIRGVLHRRDYYKGKVRRVREVLHNLEVEPIPDPNRDSGEVWARVGREQAAILVRAALSKDE